VLDTLRSDFRPNLDSKFHVFLDFAAKLTLAPETITGHDSALLQFGGLTKAAVVDGIVIVAGFNFINRLADALHFETPRPSDFWLSAHLLRWFGYRALACPWRLFGKNAWIRVADSTHSGRTDGDLSTVIDFAANWFESLTSLGRRAHYLAPDTARRVQDLVIHEPTAVTEREVADLEASGCKDYDVFDLILSAAAVAGLLRLKVGLQALDQSWETISPASRV
jgi:alkylhydroperoxidase family enzyme